MSEPAWQRRADGIEVRLRVTPRSSRDGLDGIDLLADGRAVVRVRVRAVPEDGAANTAVRQVLAKALRRPASAVTLVSGASSRQKVVSVSGDPEELAMRLAQELRSGTA
jgi:uncharacterized protein (TIGR00251 family)